MLSSYHKWKWQNGFKFCKSNTRCVNLLTSFLLWEGYIKSTQWTCVIRISINVQWFTAAVDYLEQDLCCNNCCAIFQRFIHLTFCNMFRRGIKLLVGMALQYFLAAYICSKMHTLLISRFIYRNELFDFFLSIAGRLNVFSLFFYCSW